jgi:CubicO group peptidase (beta-lactamase class C family)
MGTGGLSKTRLSRLHDVMAGHVERGAMPGVVTVVSRRGETHVDVIGTQAVGGGAPMRRDTLFRISSMSKPITAAAGLILVEECTLRLDEPLDPLLPELADRQVLKALGGPLDDTVPANRPITLRDLLTFRMGFGLLFGSPADYPILAAAQQRGVATGPPAPQTSPTADEFMRGLGELPLMYQPGERWMYDTGSSVLGVLISRVTGQPLETFLRERIFEPLGMPDTAFSVPAAKIDRLATSYMSNPETRELDLYDEAAGGQWSSPAPMETANGGLVSTADDYLAFGTMLLNQGRHGNERILSRPTVQTMTTDQLTPAQKAVSGFFPGYFDNRGWGFGVSVVTGRDDVYATPGRFGWDGGLGTAWWSDPQEELTAIMLTQRAEFHPISQVYLDFWTSVYQAIDD